jgi:hypothetical protein
MSNRKMWLIGSMAIIIAAGGWLRVNARHDDDEDEDSKKATETLRKVAKAFGGGKEADKADVETLTKLDLGESMHKFKPRDKGGFGIGDKPGAISPDGIQSKVEALGKRKLTAAAVTKEADAIAQMALEVAAISVAATAHAPKKKEPGKDPKDWKQWTVEMKDSAVELNKAAKAKSADDIKKAATKLQGSCNSCHGAFRDS